MNSKVLAIVAIIGLLVLGGGGYGFYTMKMNSPSFRGVAIPVKGLDEEIPKKWESAFKAILSQEEVLQTIIKNTDYSAQLGIPADEALNHLRAAIQVELKRRNNTLEIGLVGVRKDDEALAKIGTEVYRVAERGVAAVEPTFLQFLQASSQKSQ